MFEQRVHPARVANGVHRISCALWCTSSVGGMCAASRMCKEPCRRRLLLHAHLEQRQVVGGALQLRGLQGRCHLLHRLLPGGRPHHEFAQQGVIVRGDLQVRPGHNMLPSGWVQPYLSCSRSKSQALSVASGLPAQGAQGCARKSCASLLGRASLGRVGAR